MMIIFLGLGVRFVNDSVELYICCIATIPIFMPQCVAKGNNERVLLITPWLSS